MCPPDGHYSLLRGGLECDGQSLEAESWSAAADPDYLRGLDRGAIKRQDVIYGAPNFQTRSFSPGLRIVMEVLFQKQ